MKLKTNMSNVELRTLSKALASAASSAQESFIPENNAERYLLAEADQAVATFLSKMQTIFTQVPS